mgnify:CR=1 FL=1
MQALDKQMDSRQREGRRAQMDALIERLVKSGRAAVR